LKPMVFKKVVGLFMVAVMMATAVFSFAKHKESKASLANLRQMSWIHDGSGPATDPESYQPGNISNCVGESEICGILAPLDEENSTPTNPVPFIDDDLEDRIQSENTANGDVFLLN
ncbi:hypothetical protein, partial [Parapedobacter sp. ISTM3]